MKHEFLSIFSLSVCKLWHPIFSNAYGYTSSHTLMYLYVFTWGSNHQESKFKDGYIMQLHFQHCKVMTYTYFVLKTHTETHTHTVLLWSAAVCREACRKEEYNCSSYGGCGSLGVKAKISEQRQWDGQESPPRQSKSDTPLPATLPDWLQTDFLIWHCVCVCA